jgi:hypothetical protein
MLTTTLNLIKSRKLAVALTFSCLMSTAALAQQVGGSYRNENDASTSYNIGYYTGANQGLPDGKMSIVNPGSTGGFGNADPSPFASPRGGDLCANIYVFLPDEQMTECCSCKISPNGMQAFRLEADLIGNPLTAVVPKAGAIKIVASRSGGRSGSLPFPPSGPRPAEVDSQRRKCDAGSDYYPGGDLKTWLTHSRTLGSAVATTEIDFQPAYLSESELEKLQQTCFAITAAAGQGGLGSGHGVCQCVPEFAM